MVESHLEDTELFVGAESRVDRHYLASPQRVHVDFGSVTDRGCVRPTNQDCYAFVCRRRMREVLASNLPPESFPPSHDEAYALVVADGMGGQAAGDVASRLALETAWHLGGEEIKWPLKINEVEADELKEKAELLFRLINDAMRQLAMEQPKLAGLGTTLTIAYTVGPHAFIIHAGDSRAYLFRDRFLYRLTRDHTLMAQLSEAGYRDVTTLPDSYNHILTNCIQGVNQQDVFVDIEHVVLGENDSLLLCTDGLHGSVSDADMTQILLDHPNPQDACQALLSAALERGGDDNITVVLARYSWRRDAV
jgi:PPM family protein phosphatase